MDIERYTLKVDCTVHPIAGVGASDENWCNKRKCADCVLQRIYAGKAHYIYKLERLMKLEIHEN